MRSNKIFYISTSFAAFLMAVFTIGSINQSIVTPEKSTAHETTVVSTNPSDGEEDVARNIVVEVTFSEEMDSTSMHNSTFTLMNGTESVAGNFEYSGNKGMFTSTESLVAETVYTANLTIDNHHSDHGIADEESEEHHVVNNGKEWSFTTGGNSDPVGTVDLGSAAEYVILAKSSIHNDATSNVTGEKGFDPDKKDSKDKDKKTAYWLNNEDVDKEAVRIDRDEARKDKEEVRKDKDADRSEATRRTNENRDYSASDTTSNADKMDRAVEDMVTAYNNAEERLPVDFINYKLQQPYVKADSSRKVDRVDDHEKDSEELELKERDYVERDFEDVDNAEQRMSERTNVSSTTLAPGIYMWNDSVEISNNITLSGNADDVWIFQISEGLTVNRNVEMNLSDGAVAENIFWQVAGEVNLEEGSHFEGIILSLTGITMKNGATLNGRMLAQTDVSLDDNTITEPLGLATVQSTSSID